jgi:hypothetical protein
MGAPLPLRKPAPRASGQTLRTIKNGMAKIEVAFYTPQKKPRAEDFGDATQSKVVMSTQWLRASVLLRKKSCDAYSMVESVGLAA